MVVLIPVLKEDTILLQPPHGQVQFYALVPWNGAIHIPKLDQQGGINPVGKEYG